MRTAKVRRQFSHPRIPIARPNWKDFRSFFLRFYCILPELAATQFIRAATSRVLTPTTSAPTTYSYVHRINHEGRRRCPRPPRSSSAAMQALASPRRPARASSIYGSCRDWRNACNLRVANIEAVNRSAHDLAPPTCTPPMRFAELCRAC